MGLIVIVLEDVAVRAGSFRLKGLSLEIDSGRYAVLMGRTGCGKTTLLEAVCGLGRLEGGRILLDGRDVSRLKPGERAIGYVPQDLALFPTMSVREHLAFALRVRGRPRGEIASRVAELATLLGIEELLGRHPEGLSGGEAQRVALGRALTAAPRVLCLDEPLSALDDETREEIGTLLMRVRAETGVTTLHVTHSPQEAERLAEDLFCLRDGVITRVG